MSDPYREACQKEHRLIGHYLAVQAWVRGLDCIVLVRHDLEALLGLKRFRSTRIQWLSDDLKPWFPFQHKYYNSNALSSINTIYLSRVDMDSFLPKGSMTTAKRLREMPESSPKTERFTIGSAKRDVPTREEIVSTLAFLNAGLLDPGSIKPKDVPKRRKRK